MTKEQQIEPVTQGEEHLDFDEMMATTRTTPAPSLEYARGFEAGLNDLKALTAEEDAYHAPSQHSELADLERARSEFRLADSEERLASWAIKHGTKLLDSALRQPPSDAMADALAMAIAEMSRARGRLETIAVCNEDRRIANALGATCDHIRREFFSAALTHMNPMTDDILETLGDESDLCRNDGADDIAATLDGAIAEIVNLRAALIKRDTFIGSRGLWDDFIEDSRAHLQEASHE
jgi:hypothetical protein